MAVANAVLDVMLAEGFLEHVSALGEELQRPPGRLWSGRYPSSSPRSAAPA
jgi:4-aminobutyrate aminotransferase-like enzyme